MRKNRRQNDERCRRPIRPVIRFMAGVAAIVSVLVADGSAQGDELQLRNGDRLHGTLESTTGGERGTVAWRHSPKAATAKVPLCDVEWVAVTQRKNASAGKKKPETNPPRVPGKGLVVLSGGDVLTGTLVSLDKDSLVWEVPALNRLTIPRAMVRRIEPAGDTDATRYAMTPELYGWVTATRESSREKNWDTTAAGVTALVPNTLLAREIEGLPEQVRFDFDLTLPEKEGMTFLFLGKRASWFGLDVSFYELAFLEGGRDVALTRRERYGAPVVPVADPAIPPVSPVVSGPAHITVAIDRKSRTLLLFADGRLVRRWNDSGALREGGECVAFTGVPKGTKIGGFKASAWSGWGLFSDRDLIPSRDEMQMANHDFFRGTVITADPSQVAFASTFAGTLQVPAGQVSALVFAAAPPVVVPNATVAVAKPLPPPDVRIVLNDDRGGITLCLKKIQHDQLVGDNAWGGAVEIPLAAIARLEFIRPADPAVANAKVK